MKKYVTVWLILLAVVGFEYYALHHATRLSFLLLLQSKGFLKESFVVTTLPGRTISLWLGWLGLGLMVVMNLYSMRKRIGFMQKWGKLSDWLNFHIFCGLVGPTFILFHCDFKVRGIVGISFWSMVVSFTSGIIGRYFYIQMLQEKNYFEAQSKKMDERLMTVLDKAQLTKDDDEIKKYKQLALQYVGLPRGEVVVFNPMYSLFSAMAGDVRLMFNYPTRPQHWPVGSEYILAEYALNKRRALFLVPFQKLMGYWHTFHFPFAIFMYVVAVVHVAAALVLGV